MGNAKLFKRFSLSLAVVAALHLLASCASTPSVQVASLSPAAGGKLLQCRQLSQAFSHPHTSITSVTEVLAGQAKQGQTALPAHCVVSGKMHERVGQAGQTYAIGFETRLPVDWNGRFYYQGNGGLDGVVRLAYGLTGGGEPLTGALHQGFAVISSDAGHSLVQTALFGYDPQARLDHGYQAVPKLTPMAKALIAVAYGKAPDRSYIGGCSTGGRHAMVAAARMSDQFDGYLVGAPAYRVPLASIANLWGVVQWSPHATAQSTVRNAAQLTQTLPDLHTALTAPERRVVAQAILHRCDGLDGLVDGLVSDSMACQQAFDLQRDVPTCSGARDGSCLSAGQKQVLTSVYSGATNRSGQVFYSAFPWDTGIAGADWATWKFNFSMSLNPISVGTVFTTPPQAVNPLTADIDLLLSRSVATDALFQESGMSFMMPPEANAPVHMKKILARGGKMLLYHGLSDPIFSAEDTRQWVLRAQHTVGTQSAQALRYFPVPGMNHCGAGPATDQFDMLSALVNWVEKGQAPDQVVATARGAGNAGGVNAELPAEWAAKRTRLLCAYPQVARYQGGDTESAASFVCR